MKKIDLHLSSETHLLVWKFPLLPLGSGMEAPSENSEGQLTRIFRDRTEEVINDLSEAELKKMQEEADVVPNQSTSAFLPTPEQMVSMELPSRLLRADQMALSQDERFLEDYFYLGSVFLIHDPSNSNPNAVLHAKVMRFIPAAETGSDPKFEVKYADAAGKTHHREISGLSMIAYNKILPLKTEKPGKEGFNVHFEVVEDSALPSSGKKEAA